MLHWITLAASVIALILALYSLKENGDFTLSQMFHDPVALQAMVNAILAAAIILQAIKMWRG